MIRLDLNSNLDEIDLVEEVLERALTKKGASGETVSQFSLAVREALANAIRHGNRQDGNKRVDFELRLDKNEAIVRIQDQGRGFDPDELPDPLAAENLLKPSGRGILLMRQLSDHLEWDFPLTGGTSVTMRKLLASSSTGNEGSPR